MRNYLIGSIILVVTVNCLANITAQSTLLTKKIVSHVGTVDGGGGSSAHKANTNNRTLLDLAEKLKYEPFDYRFAEILKVYDKNIDQNIPVIEDLNRIQIYSRLQFSLDEMKRLLGADNEFFIWAFHEAMQNNSEKSSEFFDNSLYEIESQAYGILKEDAVKNVQYAFVNHELPTINDSGVISIENPETKKQLALQDRNGFVIIDKNEFNKLDLEGQLALKIHESILYLIMKYNPKLHEETGTQYIREFTANLFYYQIYKDSKKALSLETVRESFKKLNFPKIIPDYSIISKLSHEKQNSLNVCELSTSPNSSNYIFTLNEQVVAGPYLMDLDFFMKIQMYLLKNNICRFEAKKCRIESVQMPWESQPGFRFIRDGLKLFDKAASVIELRQLYLKKYQFAQICE